MSLDFSPFENAIRQLEDAIDYSQSELARNDAKLAEILRSAVIQAFEFTHDLSFKMLRRYLESIDENPSQIEKLSFSNLIRAGNAQGLLSEELAVWLQFRDQRNITSHTYDGVKAQRVFEQVPMFLREAKFLSSQLHAQQDQG
ncbi:MAG: HI0074 family nucleotidyltransferase substrate-binding subunit [Acidocella sp.]|nr:HI0074 family nucleotidyltransferase substrate-binding subunit [Acidocella sp.]